MKTKKQNTTRNQFDNLLSDGFDVRLIVLFFLSKCSFIYVPNKKLMNIYSVPNTSQMSSWRDGENTNNENML